MAVQPGYLPWINREITQDNRLEPYLLNPRCPGPLWLRHDLQQVLNYLVHLRTTIWRLLRQLGHALLNDPIRAGAFASCCTTIATNRYLMNIQKKKSPCSCGGALYSIGWLALPLTRAKARKPRLIQPHHAIEFDKPQGISIGPACVPFSTTESLDGSGCFTNDEQGAPTGRQACCALSPRIGVQMGTMLLSPARCRTWALSLPGFTVASITLQLDSGARCGSWVLADGRVSSEARRMHGARAADSNENETKFTKNARRVIS